MFTGLVEIEGTISKIDTFDVSESGGGGWSITISDSAEILGDCRLGDSICVNGVCLTVTEFDPAVGWFKVGVAPETLQRTNLGKLKQSEKVNLERAVAGHVRFGGHFVQGHVDGTVTIVSKEEDGNSLRLLFQAEPDSPERLPLLPYIVSKGFIALDGTSLTVTTVDDANRTFGIMLIAHTQNKIGLGKKPIGAKVNVEVDMVGKYVEKAVKGALGLGEDTSGLSLKGMIDQAVKNALAQKR